MDSKTSSPTLLFEKALEAFEAGGIVYADVIGQVKRLLAGGASPTELLEILRRRELFEPLPEHLHVKVLGLLNDAMGPAAPHPAVSDEGRNADADTADRTSDTPDRPSDSVPVSSGSTSTAPPMQRAEGPAKATPGAPTSVFEKVLDAIETRDFTDPDVLAELRRLLRVTGSSPTALLATLRRRRLIESLPENAYAEVLRLLNAVMGLEGGLAKPPDMEAVEDEEVTIDFGELEQFREETIPIEEATAEDSAAPEPWVESSPPQYSPSVEVLQRDGNEHTPPVEVLQHDGNEHTPPVEVLQRDGNEHTPPLEVLQRDGNDRTPPVEVLRRDRNDRTPPVEVQQRDRNEHTPATRELANEIAAPKRRAAWKPGAIGRVVGLGAAVLASAVAAWFFVQRAPVPAPVPEAPSPAVPNPGTVIRDCPTCPAMTLLPAGRFRQGLAAAESGFAFAIPQHWVLIGRPFAMSTNAVTVDEFHEFVTATGRDMQGCDTYDGEWKHRPKNNWKNPGFAQAGTHPVTCVSWNDAEAYARWLSTETGHRYRLPSASEWEYAALAGGEAVQPWGPDASSACANANLADESAARRYPGWTVFGCDDGYVYTAPVGSFKANSFGLNDMLGNVLQWTEDCWHADYSGAPIDGSARTDGDCSERELRGGSWFTTPAYVRADYRNHFAMDYRTSSVGIRLARDIEQ